MAEMGRSGWSGSIRGMTKMAHSSVRMPTGRKTLVSLHIFSWVPVQP